MVNFTRAPWRRCIIVFAWVAVIGGLLCFLLISEKSPLFPILYIRHLVNQQSDLCSEIDHAIVAENLRTFAEQQKWVEAGFDKNDPRVPAALRVLKPSAVFIRPDYVALDFGGPFFEMDVRAISFWARRLGTKKLVEGLWLYTEDGSYLRDP